jgi:nucleoid-associated protein YgaU
VVLSNSVIYWAGALGVVAITGASSILFGKPPIAWPGMPAAPVATIAHSANSIVATPANVSTFAQGAELTKAPSPGNPPKVDEQRPVFDVMRVEASGDAVIAGHASPNSAIELRDDGLVLAQAIADGSGQFVILPPPLSAGGHHLQLVARTNDASAVMSDAVAINMAAAAKAQTQVASAAVAPAPSLTQASQVVTTKAAKTAEAPPTDTMITELRSAKVIRGDSLWRISQHYLGNGMRYLQIYAANASQVHSPHLIYPGEVLVIPQASALKR